MSRNYIPAREARIEMIVVNSRFIASAAPAFSVEEARAFIDRVRGEFADASHSVPAFVIGHGSSVTAHCTDDGEPSGTAGRPALAVVQGSGIGDVVVVVTRYFGGTKLGTGGLVRAYGDATREVLKVLPLAVKVPTATLMVAVPYNLFERVRLLIEELHGETLDEDFAGDVTIVVRFVADQVQAFQDALQQLSSGKIEAEVVEMDNETIMSVGLVGADLLPGVAE
ncbi:MAG: YigZ family protein [Anaerolineae bacterium]|nr:YigZ family protein [Anaerolineae bacterium]